MRVILTPGHAILTELEELTLSWSRNRGVLRLLHREKKGFQFSMCHVSRKKQVRVHNSLVFQTPNTHPRLLKYGMPSLFESIPFIDMVSDQEIRASRIPLEQMSPVVRR